MDHHHAVTGQSQVGLQRGDPQLRGSPRNPAGCSRDKRPRAPRWPCRSKPGPLPPALVPPLQFDTRVMPPKASISRVITRRPREPWESRPRNLAGVIPVLFGSRLPAHRPCRSRSQFHRSSLAPSSALPLPAPLRIVLAFQGLHGAASFARAAYSGSISPSLPGGSIGISKPTMPIIILSMKSPDNSSGRPGLGPAGFLFGRQAFQHPSAGHPAPRSSVAGHRHGPPDSSRSGRWACCWRRSAVRHRRAAPGKSPRPRRRFPPGRRRRATADWLLPYGRRAFPSPRPRDRIGMGRWLASGLSPVGRDQQAEVVTFDDFPDHCRIREFENGWNEHRSNLLTGISSCHGNGRDSVSTQVEDVILCRGDVVA